MCHCKTASAFVLGYCDIAPFAEKPHCRPMRVDVISVVGCVMMFLAQIFHDLRKPCGNPNIQSKQRICPSHLYAMVATALSVPTFPLLI